MVKDPITGLESVGICLDQTSLFLLPTEINIILRLSNSAVLEIPDNNNNCCGSALQTAETADLVSWRETILLTLIILLGLSSSLSSVLQLSFITTFYGISIRKTFKIWFP